MHEESISSNVFMRNVADRPAVGQISDAMFAEVAPPAQEIAVDSTGMQSKSGSKCFLTPAGQENSKCVRLWLAEFCGNLSPYGLLDSWGPVRNAR